jgi:hypothetical protein
MTREPLTDAEIIAIRDECLPSQGEPFDCIAFARALLAASVPPPPAPAERAVYYVRAEPTYAPRKHTRECRIYQEYPCDCGAIDPTPPAPVAPANALIVEIRDLADDLFDPTHEGYSAQYYLQVFKNVARKLVGYADHIAAQDEHIQRLGQAYTSQCERIAALTAERDGQERTIAVQQDLIAGGIHSERDVRTRLVKAEARADELAKLLRRLREWANERSGDSWRVHDAVNPPLFEAIDAALAREQRK